VRDLIGPEVGATERALARAQMLLARYGLVSRDVLSVEAIEGGFAPIARVLRELEDHGKVRRGWFVDGLGGSQFAAPGAVDRLRTLRQAPSGAALVLAATDPAQPFGAMLPWPQRDGSDRSGAPRRSAGASVVSVDGVPVLWIERGGKRLVTFPAADDEVTMQLALRGLAKVAEQRRGKTLRIETIDGEPARTSRFSQALRAADFEGDVRGLTLEVR
jgi:ATP-dependent helicase Lhr and Lhr-like helicase